MKVIRILCAVILLITITINLLEIKGICQSINSFKKYVDQEVEILNKEIINEEIRFKNTISLASDSERKTTFDKLGFTNAIFQDGFILNKELLNQESSQEFEKRKIALMDKKAHPLLIKNKITSLEEKLESYRFLKYCYRHLPEESCGLHENFTITKSILDDSIYLGYYFYRRPGRKFIIELSGNTPTDWQNNAEFTIGKTSKLELKYAILLDKEDGLKIDTIWYSKTISLD